VRSPCTSPASSTAVTSSACRSHMVLYEYHGGVSSVACSCVTSSRCTLHCTVALPMAVPSKRTRETNARKTAQSLSRRTAGVSCRLPGCFCAFVFFSQTNLFFGDNVNTGAVYLFVGELSRRVENAATVVKAARERQADAAAQCRGAP